MNGLRCPRSARTCTARFSINLKKIASSVRVMGEFTTRKQGLTSVVHPQGRWTSLPSLWAKIVLRFREGRFTMAESFDSPAQPDQPLESNVPVDSGHDDGTIAGPADGSCQQCQPGRFFQWADERLGLKGSFGTSPPRKWSRSTATLSGITGAAFLSSSSLSSA